MNEGVLGILVDFCNALESACVNLKQQLTELHDSQAWDPDRIQWVVAEGSRGPYERSEDRDNVEFRHLLQDLAAHNGNLTRDGYFYWAFKNGSTVGRKQRQ